MPLCKLELVSSEEYAPNKGYRINQRNDIIDVEGVIVLGVGDRDEDVVNTRSAGESMGEAVWIVVGMCTCVAILRPHTEVRQPIEAAQKRPI